MNGNSASAAMTAARNVLPVPGAPARSIPRGIPPPRGWDPRPAPAVDAAPEERNRRLRMLEQVRLAAVVGERHPDLRIVRRHRVLARAREEPEQEAELDDQIERRERQLQRERRDRGDDPEHALDERDGAARCDQRREDNENEQQSPQVPVPHEAQMPEETTNCRHRKPSIFPSLTRMTRLIANGMPSSRT